MTIALLEAAAWLLLAVLWWMFYWPYRQFQIDRARQRLFVIRAELFDAAIRGEHIRFEDPAYGITRISLNGLLRTLDDYTFIKLSFVVWQSMSNQAWREMIERYAKEREMAVGELSAEGQELVATTTLHACQAVLGCVIATSLVLCALHFVVVLLRPIRILSEHTRSMTRRLVRAVSYESSLAGRDDSHMLRVRATT